MEKTRHPFLFLISEFVVDFSGFSGFFGSKINWIHNLLASAWGWMQLAFHCYKLFQYIILLSKNEWKLSHVICTMYVNFDVICCVPLKFSQISILNLRFQFLFRSICPKNSYGNILWHTFSISLIRYGIWLTGRDSWDRHDRNWLRTTNQTSVA